jgi:hypothetical protein
VLPKLLLLGIALDAQSAERARSGFLAELPLQVTRLSQEAGQGY